MQKMYNIQCTFCTYIQYNEQYIPINYSRHVFCCTVLLFLYFRPSPSLFCFSFDFTVLLYKSIKTVKGAHVALQQKSHLIITFLLITIPNVHIHVSGSD
jgi:hypothetical protein